MFSKELFTRKSSVAFTPEYRGNLNNMPWYNYASWDVPVAALAIIGSTAINNGVTVEFEAVPANRQLWILVYDSFALLVVERQLTPDIQGDGYYYAIVQDVAITNAENHTFILQIRDESFVVNESAETAFTPADVPGEYDMAMINIGSYQ